MTNHISNTFKRVSAWLYIIFAHPPPSKVAHSIGENPNEEPLRRVMKQIHLFVPTALNNGSPVLSADLRSVEDIVRDAFGACTLRPHLLGAWASETGIPYRDPILLVEIEVEDSPTLLPWLITIVRFICDRFDQEAVFITMTDVGVSSVCRGDLSTIERRPRERRSQQRTIIKYGMPQMFQVFFRGGK